MAVEELEGGSRIVGATGLLLTVIRVDEHMLGDQPLVELKTDTGAELTVTSSHLVMAISKEPVSSTLPPERTAAGRLREGDLVCTNVGEKATLTSVEIKEPEAECKVYSVFFKPNEPVLAFHCPPKQLQTCGSSATPRGRTRRSGMNRRGRNNGSYDDDITIPATYDEYQ